jgi:hypothetical protein
MSDTSCLVLEKAELSADMDLLFRFLQNISHLAISKTNILCNTWFFQFVLGNSPKINPMYSFRTSKNLAREPEMTLLLSLIDRSKISRYKNYIHMGGIDLPASSNKSSSYG